MNTDTKTMNTDKRRMNTDKRGAIALYTAKGGTSRLEVKLERQTAWLTQKQMAELFSIDRSVVAKHLKNIFLTGELAKKSNVQKMHIAFSDKPVKFYNLDVVISLGYRVNSRRATQFRIWATKILKAYLIKGYVLNQRRLLEKQSARLQELTETINFIRTKSGSPELAGRAKELLDIVDSYSSAFTTLYHYDRRTLTLQKGKRPIFVLTYDRAMDLIRQAREKLHTKGEAVALFGQEGGHKFKAVIGALYQTHHRKELYPTVEEKAAHLIYFVIKDHPFVDGNKRVAALLFLDYLNKNRYLLTSRAQKKIDSNTIVALCLLIATSDPGEKEVIIKIITNLLMHEQKSL